METTEERATAQKASSGTLIVACEEIDGHLKISVKDDGRGIDGEKIAEIALKKNLVAGKDLGTMSLEDKINLIFMPGFSSKSEVSEISGRGIGMDIVKKTVEDLGGKIKIQTAKGQGTEFQLEVSTTALMKIQSTKPPLEIEGKQVA